MNARIVRWFAVIIVLASLFPLVAVTGCEDLGLPLETSVADSDGDGWTDDQEKVAGTNPNSVDSDDDGYWDPMDPNPLDPSIPAGTDTSTPTTTPSPQTWEQKFGGLEADCGYSVQQTSDGGYIIVGRTESHGAGEADVWLVKTDSEGNKQWDKTFGGTEADSGYSVEQTSDRGYIIVGETESRGAGGAEVWLIKTDSAGNEKWSWSYGGPRADRGRSVGQTVDGGYIIVGETESYGAGGTDVWVIKAGLTGIEEWTKTFGGPGTDHGRSVGQTVDGGYVIVGETESYGAGGADVWMIKVDSEGNEEWSKTFGGPDDDRGRSVVQTLDGGYVIVGETASYGAGKADVWLIKTDSEGNREWDSMYGGPERDYGSSVQQTADAGYAIVGSTQSYGSGERDVWMIKTDSHGGKSWDRTFGGSKDDIGFSVGLTSDRGYIITGVTGFYYGRGDVWLIWVAR